MRGQATIEYLVLLSVAIIIGLVILTFMGFVPGLAGSLRERQSKMYWSSMWPLAIKDYKITETGATFLIENTGSSKVIINSITAGGDTGAVSPADYELKPNEAKTYTVTDITCDTEGEIYELDDVSITYDVVGGIQDQVEAGDRPLIGMCAS